MENPEQFDGILMTVIQKSGGIQNYFDSVFGFLFRKSDFFANPQESRKYVEDSYSKWLNIYKEKAEREKRIKERREAEEKSLKKPEESTSATVKEITPEEYLRKKKITRRRKSQKRKNHG